MLRSNFLRFLTIIAPRHAIRGDAIAADLRANGLIVAQRSKNEAITPATQIYLADTMGELGLFYTLSELVFMGGSLIAHGGQNPLEAARANNAILTGPHTHNFASIIEQFLAAQAIQLVADAAALTQALCRLLNDPSACKTLAHNAQGVLAHARCDIIIRAQCAVFICDAHAVAQ